MAAWQTRFYRAGLLLGSPLLFFVLVEIFLRSWGTGLVRREEDPILLYRFPPRATAGIDDRGFRNRRNLDTADVVALGDSNTWGYNARSRESWPSQLATQTGLVTYNLAMGGYGPAQYLHLVQRALELAPRHVIVGLSLQTDVADACFTVGISSYWRALAEERGLSIDSCRDEDVPPTYGRDVRQYWREHGNWWRRFRASSKVVNTLRKIYLNSDLDWGVGWYVTRTAALKPESYYPVLGPKVGTVVNLDQGRYMDLDRGDVRRGLELTSFFLAETSRSLRDRQVDLLVLLLPTKGSVYYEFLRQRGLELPPRFEQLRRTESRLSREVVNRLDALGIRHASVLPRLVEALRAGVRLYPKGLDGHPIGAGYAPFAETAAAALREDSR